MLRECVLSLLLAQAYAFSSTPLSTTQTAEIMPFGVGDEHVHHPNGTVSVTVSDAELTLHAMLENLPANESGGIHIHYGSPTPPCMVDNTLALTRPPPLRTGFACDNETTVKGDAPAGANKGHYYVPSEPAVLDASEDPWGASFFSDGQANAVWHTPAGSTVADLTVVLSASDLNVNPMTALDRVVIVHAPGGAKIGCGVLA